MAIVRIVGVYDRVCVPCVVFVSLKVVGLIYSVVVVEMWAVWDIAGRLYCKIWYARSYVNHMGMLYMGLG